VFLFIHVCRASPFHDETPQSRGKLQEKIMQCNYTLPGAYGQDKYVIPCSGGADSTALAVLMYERFQEIDFELLFTDTKAEDPDIYVTLDRLEQHLGKRIHRLEPDEGLYDLIEHWGGYLPSGQNRWCTRCLKLEPFESWVKTMKEREDQQVWVFVGIRADEPTRVALTSDVLNTEMPFIDLGIKREDVFRILDRSVGIPKYYAGRTRSGCSVCPFQRRFEQISLLRRHPDEYKKGMHYEKIAPINDGRFKETAVLLAQETGDSLNHLTLPIPPTLDARGEGPDLKWGRVKWGECVSLFEDPASMATLWVGAEFMVHPGVGEHGVWWQEIVTFSTSKGGLSRQLNGHYEHRLQTAEVLGLTQDDVRQESRYAVYRIEVPAKLMDVGPLKGKSFTWRKGESMSQLKHLFDWATRSLQVAGMEQQAEEYRDASPVSWKSEWRDGLLQSIARIKAETGQVVSMERFIPKEPKVNANFDERSIPCPMCSI